MAPGGVSTTCHHHCEHCVEDHQLAMAPVPCDWSGGCDGSSADGGERGRRQRLRNPL